MDRSKSDRTFFARLLVAILHPEHDRARVAVVRGDCRVVLHANHLAVHAAAAARFRTLETR